MRVTDPADGEEENLIDPRIQAAVLLGAQSNGADLAAFASEHLPGHGHPLRGPAMRGALHLLARDFDRTAVPAHGRYVGEPARADESGTTYVPPKKSGASADQSVPHGQGTAMCLARVMAKPAAGSRTATLKGCCDSHAPRPRKR